MANPLTLYIPIKQDPDIQKAAQAAHDHFVALHSGELDLFQDVHYARLVLIPNPGGSGILAICVITTFDGGMNPYLKFFWDDPRPWRSIRLTRRSRTSPHSRISSPATI